MTTQRNHRLLAGLTLAGLGLLLLAINLGWIQANVWTLLWHYWPVVLVLVGLRYLITNVALYLFAATLIIAGAVWTVSFAPAQIRNQLDSGVAGATLEHQYFSRPAASDTKQLSLKLNFAAGLVSVGALDAADQAYQVHFENTPQINDQVTNQDGQLSVQLSQTPIKGFPWHHFAARRGDLLLPSTIPVQFELDSGASQQDLDFQNIILERLKLDIGASSGTIRFGAKAASLEADIDAGASSLTLRVPRDVGLKIITNSGPSSHNFQDAGLAKTGDTYTTPAFDAAAHRITLRLSIGASSVKLDRY